MAEETIPNPPPLPQSPVPGPSGAQFGPWFNRLGLSGKLLAIGAVVGVVAAFLPAMSVSVSVSFFGQGVSESQSVIVARDWRGVVGLIGYIATLGLACLLYPAGGGANKNMVWGVAGVGAIVALMALLLFIHCLGALGTGGNQDPTGLVKATASSSIGIGAILNLLAAGAVAVGAFLKVREEKLV